MTTRAPTDRRPRPAPDRLTVRTRGLAVTLGRGRLRLRLARVKRPGVQAPGAPLPDRAQLGQVFRQGRSPGTFHRGGRVEVTTAFVTSPGQRPEPLRGGLVTRRHVSRRLD